MFGWFSKGKRNQSAERSDVVRAVISSMDNDTLLRFTTNSLAGLTHRTALSCTLIAYDNLKTLAPVLIKAAAISPDAANRWEVLADNMVALRDRATALPESTDREIQTRRSSYFLLASVLRALEARAIHDHELLDSIASLWISLAPGAKALRETIDRIKLWSADEVRLFAEVIDEETGEDYFLSFLVPRSLWENAVFVAWLEKDIPEDVRTELHRKLRSLRDGDGD